MDGDSQYHRYLFNYRKEHWATRLIYSAFIALMVASSGYEIKGDVFTTLGHWQFLWDWVACTIIIFITAWLIYWTCQILDKAVPWDEKLKSRFFAQVIMGVLGGYLFMEMLNNMYIAYGGHDVLHTPNNRTETPISLFVCFLVNGYYFGIYFAERSYRQSPEPRGSNDLDVNDEQLQPTDEPPTDEPPADTPADAPEKESPPLITFTDGEQILLNQLDIAAVGLQEGSLVIYTFGGERYYDTRTLTNFFALLDDRFYFQTSRQTIVHRHAVRSFAPNQAKKGGIEVFLTIDVDLKVEVAARNVQRFKKWLAADYGEPTSDRLISLL